MRNIDRSPKRREQLRAELENLDPHCVQRVGDLVIPPSPQPPVPPPREETTAPQFRPIHTSGVVNSAATLPPDLYFDRYSTPAGLIDFSAPVPIDPFGRRIGYITDFTVELIGTRYEWDLAGLVSTHQPPAGETYLVPYQSESTLNVIGFNKYLVAHDGRWGMLCLDFEVDPPNRAVRRWRAKGHDGRFALLPR